MLTSLLQEMTIMKGQSGMFGWSLQRTGAASLVPLLGLVGGCGGSEDSESGPARGNFGFVTSGCDTYSGSLNPLDPVARPATDGTRPGTLVEHGAENIEVQCTVSGGSRH